MTDDPTTTARLDTTDPDRPRGDVRGLGDARRAALAVRAETTIGLGVEPVAGCGLCLNRSYACPTHIGAAIADQLAPMVAGWIAEERAAIAREIEALPTTRTKAWDKGWDSVSLADVLSIARGDS